MAEVAERIRTLEIRVDRLETWAGPGQAETLAAGLVTIRADLVGMRSVQNQHTAKLAALQSDVADLKSDVAGLKSDVVGMRSVQNQHTAKLATLQSDVADLKVAVTEILRRLPPAPAASN
jgi:outer membrane murein-binding lipoprotein Lpp